MIRPAPQPDRQRPARSEPSPSRAPSGRLRFVAGAVVCAVVSIVALFAIPDPAHRHASLGGGLWLLGWMAAGLTGIAGLGGMLATALTPPHLSHRRGSHFVIGAGVGLGLCLLYLGLTGLGACLHPGIALLVLAAVLWALRR